MKNIPTFTLYKDGDFVNVDDRCAQLWIDNGWRRERGDLSRSAPCPVEDVPIEEIARGTRMLNDLRRSGINTARDFIAADIEDLLGIYGINEDNIDNYLDRAKGMIGAD